MAHYLHGSAMTNYVACNRCVRLAVQMRTLISAFYTEDLKLFSYFEWRVGGSNVQLQIKIYLHSYKLHTYATCLTPGVILFSNT
jgi:hypothetical protein